MHRRLLKTGNNLRWNDVVLKFEVEFTLHITMIHFYTTFSKCSKKVKGNEGNRLRHVEISIQLNNV